MWKRQTFTYKSPICNVKRQIDSLCEHLVGLVLLFRIICRFCFHSNFVRDWSSQLRLRVK